MFNWDTLSTNCSVYYVITSDCGVCPNATTLNMATCLLDGQSANFKMCSFAVESKVCNNIIGSASISVNTGSTGI